MNKIGLPLPIKIEIIIGVIIIICKNLYDYVILHDFDSNVLKYDILWTFIIVVVSWSIHAGYT
jgi:hypothetical protein